MPLLRRTVNNQQLTFDSSRSTVKGQLSVVRKAKGFTLIELLVVIAIIGILATFAVASFTSVQKKARDSRRKADLDAIAKALELAKSDSVGARYYPACPSGSICSLSKSTQTSNPTISPTYIKEVPQDPKFSGMLCTSNPWDNNYCYIPSSSTAGVCTGKDGANPCDRFSITSCLENSNEPTFNQGTKIVESFPSEYCASTKIYIVKEP